MGLGVAQVFSVVLDDASNDRRILPQNVAFSQAVHYRDICQSQVDLLWILLEFC